MTTTTTTTKFVATSESRWRASARERRLYGGKTVTRFFVYEAGDFSTRKLVIGYGKQPSTRKADAIRRYKVMRQREADGREHHYSEDVVGTGAFPCHTMRCEACEYTETV